MGEAESDGRTAVSPRTHFAGRTVLLTGGSGFVGRVLLAKLLSEVPDVGGVVLLLRGASRGRRGAVAPRTVGDVVQGPLFAGLESRFGRGFDAFVSRVVRVVACDLALPRIGLSDADWDDLEASVHAVLHCAASVVFDERLDLALDVNVGAPTELLALARAAGAPLTHVSTAYVCGASRGDVPERLLHPDEVRRGRVGPTAEDTPFDVEVEVARLESRVESIRQKHPHDAAACAHALVAAGMQEARAAGFHDTYTYTKFLAEHRLVSRRGDLDLAIVRPSIIEACASEPIPGWVQGLRVADPLFVGFGKGRLSDFPVRREAVLDVVPADAVARTILVAAATPRGSQPLVVHCATAANNPLTLGELHEISARHFRRHPFTDERGRAIDPPKWTWPDLADFQKRASRRRARADRSLALLGHVPGALGRKARLERRRIRAVGRQLDYYLDVYRPYMDLDVRFQVSEFRRIMAALDPVLRPSFAFDPSALDWNVYMDRVHLPGLRRYVLGANDGPRPAAVALIPDDEPDRIVPALDDPRGRRSLGERVVQRCVGWVARCVLRGFLRLGVHGLDNVPLVGPFVLASNHQSHLDTAVIRDAMGARASRLFVLAARDYFFDRPWKGWFFSLLYNTLPVSRQAVSRDGIRLCQRVLDRGDAVLLYPEGGRSPDGTLRPFKPGVGILAVDSGVPVVPVRVAGTFEALPKGRRWPRRTRLSVTFGTALEFASEAPEGGRSRERRHEYREVAERVQEAVRKLETTT